MLLSIAPSSVRVGAFTTHPSHFSDQDILEGTPSGREEKNFFDESSMYFLVLLRYSPIPFQHMNVLNGEIDFDWDLKF